MGSAFKSCLGSSTQFLRSGDPGLSPGGAVMGTRKVIDVS